jgi:oligopeptide transport system substrate-binding protein
VRAEGVRFAGAALLLLGALAGLAAWGRGSLRAPADFTFCNQAEVASLDPAIITGVPEARIVQALFEGLTRQDPVTGGPLPGLARSWAVSDDGLSWRFTLREGSLWTDGTPVTAHDVAFSLRRVLHPATAAPNASQLWCIAGARAYSHAATPAVATADDAALGIEALSDGELLITLERPTPALPAILSLPFACAVQRACVERHGSRWVAPEHLVSCGPFRLEERLVRDRLRLRRFPGYWGAGEVALESIEAWATDGGTTQVNLYLTGEADWVVRPPSGLYAALLGRPDCRRGPQAGLTFLRYNHGRAHFSDVRVRLALLLALDRQSIARDVVRGGETAADSFVPRGLPGYDPPVWPAFDAERARSLLAEAGFPGGAGFPEFELLHPHNQVARDLCESLAAQWRARLGVRCRLVNQPWKVFLDSQSRVAYDVSWSAWTADYLAPEAFLEIFTRASGNNRSAFDDPAYDELLDRASATADPAARAALLARAEQRLLDACVLGPLFQRANVNMVSPRVRGFHDNLLDVHPLRDLSVAPGGAP